MIIKGIIFDMDGTIVDAPYDWMKIKSDLDTKSKPILQFLQELEEPEKTKKWNLLEKYEREATEKAVLKEGIFDFLDFIKQHQIKSALVTNNSLENVSYLINKFKFHFDLLLSRESGLWKPSAKPFQKVLNKLQITNQECCVVGDSLFDVYAAEATNIEHIFILNGDREKFSSVAVEVLPGYTELQARIELLLQEKK
jgi:HAD superfamily hydrolase (TIGR01549 family)